MRGHKIRVSQAVTESSAPLLFEYHTYNCTAVYVLFLWVASLRLPLLQKHLELCIYCETPSCACGGQQQGPLLQGDESAHLGVSPDKCDDASSWKWQKEEFLMPLR